MNYVIHINAKYPNIEFCQYCVPVLSYHLARDADSTLVNSDVFTLVARLVRDNIVPSTSSAHVRDSIAHGLWKT